MPVFTERIAPHFSIDHLSFLDPDDPAEMADLLTGVYKANILGIQNCQEITDDAFAGDPIRKPLAGMVIENMARKNLLKVANLLGHRTVTMTALDETSEPIRCQGVTYVSQASGVANVNATNPRLRLAPAREIDRLRVYETVPDPHNTDRTRWWDGKILDDGLKTLVDIQIGAYDTGQPPRLHRLRAGTPPRH